MKNLKSILLHNKGLFILSLIIFSIMAVLWSLYAILWVQIVDSMIALNFQGVLYAFWMAILLVTTHSILGLASNNLFDKYIQKTLQSLKTALFSNYVGYGYNNFYKRSAGDYLNVITTLTYEVYARYIYPANAILRRIFSTLFSVALIFIFSWQIGLLFLLMVIIQLIPTHIMMKRIKMATNIYAEETSRFSGKTNDLLAGFEIISSRNIQKQVTSVFSTHNVHLEEARYKRQFINNLSFMFTSIVNHFITLMPLLLGALLVINGNITIGIIVGGIVQLWNTSISYVNEIVNNYKNLISGNVVAQKIEKDLQPLEAKTQISLSSSFKTLSLENIFYSIEEASGSKRTILKNINFCFEKGKKYTIIGESGSGKSTLAKIISRLFLPESGVIKVNNYILEETSLINEVVDFAPQDTYIFNDTLHNNVTLYNDAYSDEQILSKLHDVKLEDFVTNIDEKLDGIVSEQTASGGEKQRIGIARTLLSNLPVIVYDESTSALDSLLYTEIESLILSDADATVISISHRLDENMLRKYDAILVMKNGRLVESDRFDVLLKNDAEFSRLYGLTS